jgi:hypothetical protein
MLFSCARVWESPAMTFLSVDVLLICAYKKKALNVNITMTSFCLTIVGWKSSKCYIC